MADRSITVTILGDASSFQKAMGQADAAAAKTQGGLGATLVGFDGFFSGIERGAHTLERLAQHTEYVATGFRNLRGILFGGALTFGFASMIQGAEDFNLQADRMTRVLNGNAQAGSAWAGIAKALGLDSDMVATSFGHLSGLIETQKPLLGQLGIAYQDSKGNLLSLNDVIAESADWFQKHAGASNEAAVAQQLFGRNAQQLLPVLEQGSSGISALTAEMQKLGFVMSSDQLQQQVAFTHSLEEGKLAAEGLFERIGNALIPGFAALAQAVADNIPLMDGLVAAINRAVSYVIGFVEGLTGQTLEVGKAAQTLGALTDQTKSYGTAQDLAQGSTKANTQALDNQIQSLQDQKSAYDAVIDAQLQQYQLEQRAADFANKVSGINQKKADDDKSILDAQHRYQTDLLSGNLTDLQSALDAEASAKDDEAKQDQDLAKTTADYQRQQQIQTLQDQKAARDKDFQDQIKALNDLKSKISQSAQDSVGAVSDAFGKMGAIGTQAGNDLADKLKFALDPKSEDLGKSAAQKIDDAITNHKWDKVGDAVGSALLDGIDNAIQAKLEENKLYDLAKLILDINTGNAGAWAKDISSLFSGVGLSTPYPQLPLPPPVSQGSGGTTTQGGAQQGRFPGSDAHLAALQAIARNTTPAPAVGLPAQVALLNGTASAARMRGFNTTSV